MNVSIFCHQAALWRLFTFSHNSWFEGVPVCIVELYLEILNPRLKIHLMNKNLEVDHWNYSFYRPKCKRTSANLMFWDFTVIWWPNYSVNSKITKINLIQHNVSFQLIPIFSFSDKKWLQKWSKRESRHVFSGKKCTFWSSGSTCFLSTTTFFRYSESVAQYTPYKQKK